MVYGFLIKDGLILLLITEFFAILLIGLLLAIPAILLLIGRRIYQSINPLYSF